MHAIEDTIYAWMPRWFLVMMLVSSVGGALMFVLTIRVCGRKGYAFLALASAIPAAFFARDILQRKIEEHHLRSEFPGLSFGDQGSGTPEIPWMSVLMFIGALMLYRSERNRANQAPDRTAPSVTPPAAQEPRH